MNSERLTELAVSLGNAWTDASAIAAPTSLEPSLTLDNAYEIQDLIIGKRLGSGRQRAGWKMGLTSAGPGHTPIVGTLLDDMIVPSGTDLSLAEMVGPMVEAELVVQVGETIDEAITIAELEAGPHRVGGGIEVIDYRTVDSSGPIDWVADNSTVAYAVVGATIPVADVTLSDVEASLSCESRHLASGNGAQVMGNPLAAVAWLSQHLTKRGLRLERGHMVLTGSLTGHHLVAECENHTFTAEFGSLGSVHVQFGP